MDEVEMHRCRGRLSLSLSLLSLSLSLSLSLLFPQKVSILPKQKPKTLERKKSRKGSAGPLGFNLLLHS